MSTVHDHNFTDPFRSNWFLNPLRWLADTSTPDGKTMPLDDGNKARMYNTRLLGWDGTYGDRCCRKEIRLDELCLAAR